MHLSMSKGGGDGAGEKMLSGGKGGGAKDQFKGQFMCYPHILGELRSSPSYTYWSSNALGWGGKLIKIMPHSCPGSPPSGLTLTGA